MSCSEVVSFTPDILHSDIITLGTACQTFNSVLSIMHPEECHFLNAITFL